MSKQSRRFDVPDEIQSEIENRVSRVKGLTAALYMAAIGRLHQENDETPSSCDLSQEWGESGIGDLADAIGEELTTIVDVAYGHLELEDEDTKGGA